MNTAPQQEFLWHPTRQELDSFGQGRAAQQRDVERIERHLAECSLCRSLVADSPDDPLMALLAGLQQLAPAAALRMAAGYEILEELGRGGMGVVYRARQTGLNRIVALKRMRAGALATAEDLVRFRREAMALARLQHPNIVQVYDVGEQEGHPYLAMEYVEGSSLRERLERSPLPPHESAALIAVLADAVHFAHGQGIIHRDLKPGNVLLSRLAAATEETGKFPAAPTQGDSPGNARTLRDLSESAKIADFGLAKLFDADSEPTRTGMLLGTPGYMAPEQSRGPSSRVGPAADIYALGAILYEALTGRPPFRAATPFETLELVHTCDPVPPRRLQPHIPRDLDTICLTCLRRDAAARYTSAAALAAELRRFLAGQPVEARPAGPVERFWKWTRRRPAWAAVCSVSLLALCGAAAGLVLHQQQLERQTVHAEQNYRDAWQSLQRLLVKLEDPRWGDAARLPQLKREQYEAAIPFFENILADTFPTNRDMRIDRVQAHGELARLHSEMGNLTKAERHANEAIDMLRRMLAGPEASPKLHYLLGESCLRMAILRLQTGDVPGELKFLQAGFAEFQHADAEVPNDSQVQSRIADCLLAIGSAHCQLEQLEAAEQYYRRALDIRRELLKADPGAVLPRLGVGEAYLSVIEIARQRNADEAPNTPDELKRLLDPLGRVQADELEDPPRVAALYLRWGKFLAAADEPASLEKFTLSQRLLEDYRARHPGALPVLGPLFDLYATRARLAADHGRFADALPDWDRAAAIAPSPGDLRFIRMNRLLALAHGSFGERALKEAKELAADETLGPDDCFYVGRNLAIVSSSQRSDLTRLEADCMLLGDRYASLSFQFLTKAGALGYFRDHPWGELLERDPAFWSFRDRDDFRALLTDQSPPRPVAQRPRTGTQDH